MERGKRKGNPFRRRKPGNRQLDVNVTSTLYASSVKNA
jgi:hypothetical protein